MEWPLGLGIYSPMGYALCTLIKIFYSVMYKRAEVTGHNLEGHLCYWPMSLKIYRSHVLNHYPLASFYAQEC